MSSGFDMTHRLSRDFFERPTLTVAQELLGQELYFQGKHGIITETEAYIGQDDPACHAAKGLTPRTRVMFGPGGFSYVYFIYGMYHCLNFVTEREERAAAVLIRALEIDDVPMASLNGPGKLCRHLQITKAHNAIDITQATDFYVRASAQNMPFDATPRIGIRVGMDKLWRFVAKR